MKNILTSLNNALGVLRTTRNAAAVGAAVTGMTIVFAIGFNGLAEYVPRPLAFILAASAVAMVAFVIDYGLRETLPLSFDLLISGQWLKDWRTAAFMVLLLSFNFIQAFSSMKLSWEGRKEAIAVMREAPELDNIAQVKRDVDVTGNAKIRAMDSEISKLRKDIERKESEVKRLYPTYVDVIDSEKDKYGWHAAQLDKKIERKTGPLQKELTALLAARTKAIEIETETAAATVASVAQVNTSKWNEYEISKTRNMAYIGYFGAGCTIILIVISLMLSLLGQSNVASIEQKDIASPITKAKTKTPPHVAPARAETEGSFETVRALEAVRAETEALRIETERLKRKAIETEAVRAETETVKRPVSVSDSSETLTHETVKSAVKEAVRETRPETVRETVETVRKTVKAETKALKRKPVETVVIRETVKPVPPKRKRKPVETVKKETVRKCANPKCKKDISHKRSTAKYCDTQCKNAANNAKR